MRRCWQHLLYDSLCDIWQLTERGGTSYLPAALGEGKRPRGNVRGVCPGGICPGEMSGFRDHNDFSFLLSKFSGRLDFGTAVNKKNGDVCGAG